MNTIYRSALLNPNPGLAYLVDLHTTSAVTMRQQERPDSETGFIYSFFNPLRCDRCCLSSLSLFYIRCPQLSPRSAHPKWRTHRRRPLPCPGMKLAHTLIDVRPPLLCNPCPSATSDEFNMRPISRNCTTNCRQTANNTTGSSSSLSSTT